MRLNKRRIAKAPKREPGELEIELSKLKLMKNGMGPKWRSVAVAFKNAVTWFKNAISQIGNTLYQIFKPVVDIINNYQTNKKEDGELFKALPSVRRFEHNLI